MMGEIRDFWFNEYAPALWRKLTGRLTEDQLEPPATTLDFDDDELVVPDFPGIKLKPSKKTAAAMKQRKARMNAKDKPNNRNSVGVPVKRKRSLTVEKNMKKEKRKSVETIEWSEEEEGAGTFEFAHVSSFVSKGN